MTHKPVRIGIIGAGFLAETRARCYGRLGAGRASLAAVHSRTPETAKEYARRHGVGTVCPELEDLLGRDDIDMVDLCVPNHLHRPMTEAAARAGKHIVCTKPLTAYVGQDLPEDADDEAVSGRGRREMLALAVDDAEAMVKAARDAGVHLMYGENWVYAPSIARARDLLETSGGSLLEMRGWEGHQGSHSPYSKSWRYTGGGALLRLGAHPIGAMIHLKAEEGIQRDGEPIPPISVLADTADLSLAIPDSAPKPYVVQGWKDVENWGCVIVTFGDGTRGIAYGSDNTLGGMQSRLEISASNCHLQCQLSPNDMVRAYAPHEGVFSGEYIMEKIDTPSGWTTPMPSEDWTSGQLAMCEDFVEAVADNRAPISKGTLGALVVQVVYAAYVSAHEGCRVSLIDRPLSL